MAGYLSQSVFRRGIVNVLEGIARYGVIRPQVTAAPFLVVWDCTHACNLRCKHCYESADKPMPDELSTEEAKDLIDQLVESGVVAIAFSGGEPLVRDDFFELARYASDRDLYTALATNGTLITRTVAKKLKDAVGYVEISLDGATPETHDALRGKDTFEKTIAGIKNCIAEGSYTGVATTVTKRTLGEIPAIYDLCNELGVNRLICFNFVPTGRGVDLRGEDITPEEREELMGFLYEKLMSEGTQAFTTAPQFARVSLERGTCAAATHFYVDGGLTSRTRALTDFIGGCGAGRLYCAIEPNGDVRPCVFLPITVGNVREKNLKEIWHESELLKKLRNRSDLGGYCGDCEYKFVCGGCRSRAYAYFGDVLAPDPGCVYNSVALGEGDDVHRSPKAPMM